MLLSLGPSLVATARPTSCAALSIRKQAETKARRLGRGGIGAVAAKLDAANNGLSARLIEDLAAQRTPAGRFA
jgi:hypothetical protein